MPRFAETVHLGQSVHVVNEADACLAGLAAEWDSTRRTLAATALHLGSAGFAEWVPHRGLRHDPAGYEGGTFHLPEECPRRR